MRFWNGFSFSNLVLKASKCVNNVIPSEIRFRWVQTCKAFVGFGCIQIQAFILAQWCCCTNNASDKTDNDLDILVKSPTQQQHLFEAVWVNASTMSLAARPALMLCHFPSLGIPQNGTLYERPRTASEAVMKMEVDVYPLHVGGRWVLT